jgi:hypothetical protein
MAGVPSADFTPNRWQIHRRHYRAVNDKQIVFLAEALGVEIGDLFPRKLPGSSTVIAPKPAAARR